MIVKLKRIVLFSLVLVSIYLVSGMNSSAWAKYSSIIIDADSGKIFSSENADIKRHPASLTKIMTLYMVFDALDKGKLKLNTKMKVSKRASRMPRSKLWLKPGSTITVKNAILALVTRSANDVAVVTAEHLGGSEKKFAKKMTSQARAMGMRSTTFMNASGLRNKKQLSTARDMALLGQRIRTDFPEQYKYFSIKRFKYMGQSHSNHNRLLGQYEGTDGIKTGYIAASGFNLVASVQRGERRLIGVVFGGRSGRSRDKQMMKLLDRAYRGIEIAAVRPPDRFAEKKLPVTIAGLSNTDNPFDGMVNTDAVVSNEMVSVIEVVEAGDLDGWAIQVGAFRYKAKANQAAHDAVVKLGVLAKRAKVLVTPVDEKGRKLFRARLSGFDETTARQSCKVLKTDGGVCVPVILQSNEQVAFSGQ